MSLSEKTEEMRGVIEVVSKEQSLGTVPLESELTTSQAAEIIGVSPSFLTELLEQGDIPFRRVGAYCRVYLADVLAYGQERERRIGIMESLVAETEELGLYS